MKLVYCNPLPDFHSINFVRHLYKIRPELDFRERLLLPADFVLLLFGVFFGLCTDLDLARLCLLLLRPPCSPCFTGGSYENRSGKNAFVAPAIKDDTSCPLVRSKRGS